MPTSSEGSPATEDNLRRSEVNVIEMERALGECYESMKMDIAGGVNEWGGEHPILASAFRKAHERRTGPLVWKDVLKWCGRVAGMSIPIRTTFIESLKTVLPAHHRARMTQEDAGNEREPSAPAGPSYAQVTNPDATSRSSWEVRQATARAREQQMRLEKRAARAGQQAAEPSEAAWTAVRSRKHVRMLSSNKKKAQEKRLESVRQEQQLQRFLEGDRELRGGQDRDLDLNKKISSEISDEDEAEISSEISEEPAGGATTSRKAKAAPGRKLKKARRAKEAAGGSAAPRRPSAGPGGARRAPPARTGRAGKQVGQSDGQSGRSGDQPAARPARGQYTPSPPRSVDTAEAARSDSDLASGPVDSGNRGNRGRGDRRSGRRELTEETEDSMSDTHPAMSDVSMSNADDSDMGRAWSGSGGDIHDEFNLVDVPTSALLHHATSTGFHFSTRVLERVENILVLKNLGEDISTLESEVHALQLCEGRKAISMGLVEGASLEKLLTCAREYLPEQSARVAEFGRRLLDSQPLVPLQAPVVLGPVRGTGQEPRGRSARRHDKRMARTTSPTGLTPYLRKNPVYTISSDSSSDGEGRSRSRSPPPRRRMRSVVEGPSPPRQNLVKQARLPLPDKYVEGDDSNLLIWSESFKPVVQAWLRQQGFYDSTNKIIVSRDGKFPEMFAHPGGQIYCWVLG
jgi:hypothetical protein